MSITKCIIVAILGISALRIMETSSIDDNVSDKPKEESIVLRKFNATDIDNKTVIEYQIRKIPENLYEKATDIMVKYWSDETIARANSMYRLYNVHMEHFCFNN